MTIQTILRAAIPQLSGRHILVVGDLFLDEYLIGRAVFQFLFPSIRERISYMFHRFLICPRSLIH